MSLASTLGLIHFAALSRTSAGGGHGRGRRRRFRLRGVLAPWRFARAAAGLRSPIHSSNDAKSLTVDARTGIAS